MSRVDDSNAERRAQEARAAERRNQERLTKQRTAESTAFDRALQQKSAEQPPARSSRTEVKEPHEEHAPLEEGEALHESEAASVPGQEQKPKQADARGRQQKTFGEKLEDKGKPPPRNQQAPTGVPLHKHEARTSSILKQSKEHVEKGSEAHSPDAKSDDINLSVATGGGAAKKQGPVDRASDDTGKGSGQEKDTSSGKDKNAAFKLPPAALMAPPPLARPRDTGQAARLSSVTKEIVEKIVSRVLVGTNEKGVPEFRIDLKSGTLGGLSIKVSGGRGGKIRAVFSGSDREVLKALKGAQDDLKNALAAKGLSLEEIAFEEA